MNRLINKIISISIAVICMLSSITAFAADNVIINLDGSSGYWSSNKNLIKTVETDEQTGNKYFKFEYSNPTATAPLYFESTYPSSGASSTLKMSGNIVMSFDVKFEGDDGAIYLKDRRPSINDIVIRICVNEGGRLMYGTKRDNGYKIEHFYDENGDYFVPGDKWYNVQVLANITENESEALQSIYITDIEANELVTKAENKPLVKAVANCNIIMAGASCTMGLDNVIVMNPDVQDVIIAGNPYPKRPTSGTARYSYYTKGKTSTGLSLYKVEDAEWSLLNDVDGVTISNNGILSVEATAPIRPIVIKAELNGSVEYYLVEIEK